MFCENWKHRHAPPSQTEQTDRPPSATDSPCGVWVRGWTTCLLYDGPLFGSHFKMRVGMLVWGEISYIYYYFLPRFTVSYMQLVIILLINNLFIYEVLCTLIYHRRGLYAFLFYMSGCGQANKRHSKGVRCDQTLTPPLSLRYITTIFSVGHDIIIQDIVLEWTNRIEQMSR